MIQYATGNKERKVNYSDMGNAIDLFSSADGSPSPIYRNATSGVPRYDSTYPSKSGNNNWSDGSPWFPY